MGAAVVGFAAQLIGAYPCRPTHRHPLYYGNVIETLRGQAEPETDGREGLKTLELLIAMYLSSRDGKRVALPLDY